MLSVTEALEVVLREARPLGVETVSFGAARGRVLAETVRADRDQPPFDRAMVDGIAVRAASVAGGGRLRMVGEVAAGKAPRVRVGPGEAASVMTGASMPEGADAALMVEHTVREAEGDREFVSWPAPGTSPPPAAPGTGVAWRGSEIRAGTPLLAPGIRLSAAAVGVLAAVGRVRVLVRRRPRTAVLSTGDELVHPRTRVPGPARIRDANSHLVAARCRALGLPVHRLGVAPDDPAGLAAAIGRGLAADVLFLSGGVSMGRFDFVEPVLARLGVRLLVTAVRIRPGKPFVFGVCDPGDGGRRTLVFGLPGNPVSAFTTFEVLARPGLERLEDAPGADRPRIRVRLLAPMRNPGPRPAFLPGRVSVGAGGELAARPVRSAGSADLGALAQANALLVVPERAGAVPAGAAVTAVPLAGFPDAGPVWKDPRG